MFKVESKENKTPHKTKTFILNRSFTVKCVKSVVEIHSFKDLMK